MKGAFLFLEEQAVSQLLVEVFDGVSVDVVINGADKDDFYGVHYSQYGEYA